MDRFVSQVLEWGNSNFRPFPWRFNRTTYKVFVAEFLLQKTDAQKVAYVFEPIIEKYPNLKALSKANEAKLKKYIDGLGLSYRSRRMIEAAKTFMTRFGGVIPCNQEALLGVKGIGKYMANAVLCFGFGISTPILDTNIAKNINKILGDSTTNFEMS